MQTLPLLCGFFALLGLGFLPVLVSARQNENFDAWKPIIDERQQPQLMEWTPAKFAIESLGKPKPFQRKKYIDDTFVAKFNRLQNLELEEGDMESSTDDCDEVYPPGYRPKQPRRQQQQQKYHFFRRKPLGPGNYNRLENQQRTYNRPQVHRHHQRNFNHQQRQQPKGNYNQQHQGNYNRLHQEKGNYYHREVQKDGHKQDNSHSYMPHTEWISFDSGPYQYQNLEPKVFDIQARSHMPIVLQFRTISSPLMVKQVHTEGTRQEFEPTKTEEEPQVLKHQVIKPIVQELHEIIKPFRRIITEVFPVQEHVQTIVAKARKLSQSKTNEIDKNNHPNDDNNNQPEHRDDVKYEQLDESYSNTSKFVPSYANSTENGYEVQIEHPTPIR